MIYINKKTLINSILIFIIVLFFLTVYIQGRNYNWEDSNYCARQEFVEDINNGDDEYGCLLNDCKEFENDIGAEIMECVCSKTGTIVHTYCTERFKGEKYVKTIDDVRSVVINFNNTYNS